jgi:hypothetical protein
LRLPPAAERFPRTKQAGGVGGGAEGVANPATLRVRAAELKEGGGGGEGDSGVRGSGEELLIKAMAAMSGLNSKEKADIALKLFALLAEPHAESVRGRRP